MAAKPLTNRPAKLYRPNTVLTQSGSSDMIQSVLASQRVIPKTTRNSAARRLFRKVPAGDGSTSCRREVRTMAQFNSSHKSK